MPTDLPSPAAADLREGIPFLGGSLWIDLVNSRFALDGQRFDFLATDALFRHWLTQAGIIIDQGEIEAERAAATVLRDLLDRAFETLQCGRSLAPSDIAAVNMHLAGQRTGYRLARISGNNVLEQIPADAGAIAAGTIALDFARFIVDYESARLKGCANPSCAMVFYDRGRNSRRRWCTMSICGNRDKVARYRARQTQS